MARTVAMFPPGGVAGDGDTGRVEPAVRALLDDPLSGGVGLLVLCRVLRLGCERVLHKGDDGIRSHGQPAGEKVVGDGAADDPTASVQVQHDGQWTCNAWGLMSRTSRHRRPRAR